MSQSSEQERADEGHKAYLRDCKYADEVLQRANDNMVMRKNKIAEQVHEKWGLTFFSAYSFITGDLNNGSSWAQLDSSTTSGRNRIRKFCDRGHDYFKAGGLSDTDIVSVFSKLAKINKEIRIVSDRESIGSL